MTSIYIASGLPPLLWGWVKHGLTASYCVFLLYSDHSEAASHMLLSNCGEFDT